MTHARGTFGVSPLAVLLLLLAVPLAARAQSNRFLEAGIPTADREWLGSDYERTVQIFSAGKVALPRFSDPQGTALLRRMTSTENFSFHRNKSLPLRQRMDDFLKMSREVPALLELYLSEPRIGGGPHQEVAALLAFVLQMSALSVELSDEWLPADSKTNPDMRMAGLFLSTEQMLTEQQDLFGDDLSVILKAMESTLPRIKKKLSQDSRVELRKKLEADKARFSKPEDVERLNSMIRELSV